MAQSHGLLGEIENDLLSGRPIADVLRKIVILGGRAGSPELCGGASRELKSFTDIADEDVPPYRHIFARSCLTRPSHWSRGMPVPYSALPDAYDGG